MEDYTTRGVKSHQSRVANLSQFLNMDLAEFFNVFARNLIKSSGSPFEAVRLSPEEEKEVASLCAFKYDTDEWTWGRSPQYDFVAQARFNAGNIMACASLVGGYIERLDFYGDFFEVVPIENFSSFFEGVALGDVASVIEAHDVSAYIHGFTKSELSALLAELLD